MSDPWETLAVNQPEQSDNGEWGQSDEWAQSKTRKSPPQTRSTRGGSPNSPPRTRFMRGSPIRRNFGGSRVRRTRSPSNSPPPRRQYRGGGRSRSPWCDREGSRSFRGNRGREGSRSFRGNRGREGSRSFRGNRGREGSRSFRGRGREASRGREVSRSSRRPDFSNSPTPGFRGRNNYRGERNRRSIDSRSISPDNHFRRNRDRGRSPFCRNKSREKSNGPGASWTKKESDGWGQNSSWNTDHGRPGVSWTKKESDGQGQTGGPGASWTENESEEPGGLSPWSKAAEDIKINYNDKEIDGWGEELGQSGADAWNINNNNNNGNGNNNNNRSTFSPELGEDDLRFLLNGSRTGEERENWRRSGSRGRERERSRGRERDRRERSSEWQRRGRESRERRDDEKPSDNNGQKGWNEGQKWRDWSINAFQNSIKDINWSDFKWTDNNTNNNENNNNSNNDNNVITGNERAVENQNPSNGDQTGHDVKIEPGANGNVDEILNAKMGVSSSQLNHEDGKLQNKPSENEVLQTDPADLPPLLYDPWDMNSELPQQIVIKKNHSSNRLGPCEPSAFNAHPVEKVKSPTGYESSVENEILTKPPGFEEVNPNNGLNPGGTVFDASQLEDDLPPSLNDPWASDFGENKSIYTPNQSNWANKNVSISLNQANNALNASNWGSNTAPNVSNLGNNVPISSNWVSNTAPNASNLRKNVPNSSNWESTIAPISSNRANTAQNLSNWGCNNASSSSNLGCNNAPSLSNWATKTSNSSNWAYNLSNSSNRPNNNASNSSNWANASSSKSPIRPPGFENLPTKPPGFENPVQKTPKKPQIPKPKPHQTLIPNPNAPKKQSEPVSIFRRGITDFAEEKMEPFFTKGFISGKIYASLINKFVAKVSSAVGPVEPRTEVEVHNFLRDQNAKLTRLAHEYLSMHVGRQVVQEVTRSTR